MTVRYTDGREEVLRAGEMFYLPPGHTPLFQEDSAFVEFSPQRGYEELITRVSTHRAKRRSGLTGVGQTPSRRGAWQEPRRQVLVEQQPQEWLTRVCRSRSAA